MAPRKPHLLIVEDDEAALFGYQRYLEKAGYTTKSAGSLAEGRKETSTERFDAVLLDLNLPDGNSLELIRELKGSHPYMPVIVITGMSDIATAVKATKYGAENFLTKPVQMEELTQSLEKALEIETLRRKSQVQQRLQKSEEPYFGQSDAIQRTLEYSQVAAANDTVLLILGDTGTGKGVLARWIHDNSDRRGEAFVELNCSSLRGELLRSELFGHAKGSFTSAVKDREGLVEVADGGTLFLDEIGDMDVEVQAQMLKTIEERSYRRIGENRLRRSEFRLICATNRDLLRATKEGTFRTDLYYRICVFPIALPPLRDRIEDIAGMAEHILSGFGYPHLPLSPEVANLLVQYSWPGNVRELRNMLERAMLLSRGEPLSRIHFPGLEPSVHLTTEEPRTSVFSLEEIEKRHITKVLKEFDGDKNRASEALGISLSSLYRRLGKMQDS